MPLEARLLTGLALALALVYWTTPIAIRVAHRFEFYDKPIGYKGHRAPTPYLGGSAVVLGFVATVLALTGDWQRTTPLVAGVLVLWVVGTVDDRRQVAPGYRVAVECAIAAALWATDLGWSLGLGDGVDLVVTTLWIVGVVNAFNLFDNLDGAASTMALVVASAVAVLGVVDGDVWVAVTAAALCGACIGFLPHNLALPGARIFLGDGGSMPVGFAVAALVMIGASSAAAEWQALVLGLLLVGIPALDTTLVVVSRRRRGISLLTGGRDHLTHRTLERVRTARAVAVALGGTQALLAALAIVSVRGGSLLLVVAVALYLAGVVTAIAVLDAPGARPEPTGARPGATSMEAPGRGPLLPWAALALAPLGLAMALSPFAGGFYDSDVWTPAGVVLCILLITTIVARTGTLPRPAIAAVGLLAALAAWSLASASWADSVEQAVVTGNRWAVYAVLLGLLVALVRNEHAFTWLLASVAVGVLVVAAVVVARLLDGNGEALLISGRLEEPLGYANAQASVFLLGLWPCMALAEQRRSAALAAVGMTGATLLAAMIVLSQSRGVTIAAIASAAVVFAFVPGRVRRALAFGVLGLCLLPALSALLDVFPIGLRGRVPADVLQDAGTVALLSAGAAGLLWLAASAGAARLHRLQSPAVAWTRRAVAAGIGLAALLAALVAVVSFGEVRGYVDRQYDAFVTVGGATGEPTASRLASGSGNRYDYWRIAVRAWHEDELRGIGAGSYDRLYFAQRTTTEDIRQPHSLQLQTLAETGLVGLLLLAAFLIAVAVGARRHIAAARRVRSRAPFLTASVGVFVAWLVHTSVDWLHLLPGLTGIALAAAAVLLARPDHEAAEARGVVAPASPRRRAPQLALVGLGALALMASAVSLSRQALAEHYRDQAQSALATRPAEALERSNRSLRLDADAVPTYYAKAAALARLGEGAAAERVLTDATRREPADFVTWALLGDLAVRRGDLSRAQRHYRRASSLNPRDPGLRALADDPRLAAQRLAGAAPTG